MIVLDTNVLSETMRPAPAERVVRWLSDQPAAALFTTTLTQAEILYGLQLLPAGRRREDLGTAVAQIFAQDLAGRILSFDGDAARSYAQIAAARRLAGLPISQIDAQIAAIVHSRGARLATRNVADFAGCGIEVVDPWAA